jgi:2-oxoglutarate dehydrogenase E1 component
MSIGQPPAQATALDPDWIDELYERWREDPGALSATWQAFFQGFDLAMCDRACVSGEKAQAQSRVVGLIDAFRRSGHTSAWLDPLQDRPALHESLRLEAHGFGQKDLRRVFDKGDFGTPGQATLEEIHGALQRTWCGSIGTEFMHIQQRELRAWIQAHLETAGGRPSTSEQHKRDILERLIDAEVFETFLHTRYRGQKRFSLEGAEAAIPALHALVELAPKTGVKEIVLGMAHRGRLNVLANIMDKSYAEIFSEFEGSFVPGQVYGNGDVRYHKGFSSDHFNRDGEVVHISLTANPSHLEAVDPVVQGKARAKQRQRGDAVLRRQVLPVLVHGDAAFAGQGIVAETLNLSQLEGYGTGGTVHLVINNGIGFTATPEEARSSRYCTDVAKMVEAPIFHVNGDDPEAVVFVMELALRFRQRFGRDVVVDMVCYRRHGHNEGDEPAYTQPLLYDRIRNHLPVRHRYTAQLVAEGLLGPAEEDGMAKRLERRLAIIHDEVRRGPHREEEQAYRGRWQGMEPPWPDERTMTGVDREVLEAVGAALTTVPEGFSINRKMERLLSRRAQALDSGGPIDWALAESLAWGALLVEGYQVRLSGQDSVRGTFSQRHAEWTDVRTAERYRPLNNIRFVDRPAPAGSVMGLEGEADAGTISEAGGHQRPSFGHFCVYNSAVSEAAVLGFDFGYSLAEPEMLIHWEAQFGDFANGAQTIIDQFVTGSFSKWSRSSGLVMLLPHGYEGQGPEHSNAYLERYLAACAEINIQVAQPSTPAQYFHLLRRQMLRPFRIPLVVMTPKGLLRHPACVSHREELESGGFEELLDDRAAPSDVERVVLVSGRLYYDLLARRAEEGLEQRVALVRVEQFYPTPTRQLHAVMPRYGDARWVWAQEEPRNRGGWSFMNLLLQDLFPGRRVDYAGRRPSASPATGSSQRHSDEQDAVIRAALGLPPGRDDTSIETSDAPKGR